MPVALLYRNRTADAVIAALTEGPATVEAVGSDIYSSRVDVPKGEWLLWPDDHSALWVGARHDQLPRAARERLARPSAIDATDPLTPLTGVLEHLSDVGVWVREAAVLIDDHWTRPRRADSALQVLSNPAATGLSGVFVDRAGQSARLEIAAGGLCWTDRPALAIEWLLQAIDLPQPI